MQIYLSRTLVLITIMSMFFGLLVPFTYIHAHEGHVHTELTVKDTRNAELISLMQRLVYLLIALRDVQNSTGGSMTTETESSEMELHHAEHATEVSTTSVTTTEPRLVIEVETHFTQTHVHVRYVDKPEEMFFVPVSIDDEDGIIREIIAHTGISESVIREALTYFR